jgi:hypothetical protein
LSNASNGHPTQSPIGTQEREQTRHLVVEIRDGDVVLETEDVTDAELVKECKRRNIPVATKWNADRTAFIISGPTLESYVPSEGPFESAIDTHDTEPPPPTDIEHTFTALTLAALHGKLNELARDGYRSLLSHDRIGTFSGHHVLPSLSGLPKIVFCRGWEVSRLSESVIVYIDEGLWKEMGKAWSFEDKTETELGQAGNPERDPRLEYRDGEPSLRDKVNELRRLSCAPGPRVSGDAALEIVDVLIDVLDIERQGRAPVVGTNGRAP